MYATDGQTDKQMDGRTKAKLTAPFPTGGGITKAISHVHVNHGLFISQNFLTFVP